jgi:hypothetical protein
MNVETKRITAKVQQIGEGRINVQQNPNIWTYHCCTKTSNYHAQQIESIILILCINLSLWNNY